MIHLGMISSLKDNPDAVPHVVVLHHVHNPGYVRHHKPRSSKMPESQQLFSGLRLVSRIFKEFQHPAI